MINFDTTCHEKIHQAYNKRNENWELKKESNREKTQFHVVQQTVNDHTRIWIN